jgi:hypothetical protein
LLTKQTSPWLPVEDIAAQNVREFLIIEHRGWVEHEHQEQAVVAPDESALRLSFTSYEPVPRSTGK